MSVSQLSGGLNPLGRGPCRTVAADEDFLEDVGGAGGWRRAMEEGGGESG